MVPEDGSNIYKEPPIGVRKDGSSYTVLVVDDSRTIREMLKQILMSVKFKILDEADNGEVAVIKIKNQNMKPDFIFIDMDMPVMNGIETVKKLRPILPDTRIIMVTSHGEKETVMEIIQSGVNEYIKKPFDRDTVIAKVRGVLKAPLK
ncbi:MAG: response regulator [Spirochaetes bacterium]|nr:response regulator [Spirochaetota bacterium]